MLCKDCPKKTTCTKLCPEVEEYANQDYVALRELPIVGFEHFEHTKENFPDGPITIYLTHTEIQIVRWLKKSKTREDIAYRLNTTRNSIDQHIFRILKKYKKPQKK